MLRLRASVVEGQDLGVDMGGAGGWQDVLRLLISVAGADLGEVQAQSPGEGGSSHAGAEPR